MANQKLTPLQEVEAQRRAAAEAKANKVPRAFTDEQKATRKERVVKAKDALTRSVGMKGRPRRRGPQGTKEVPPEPE